MGGVQRFTCGRGDVGSSSQVVVARTTSTELCNSIATTRFMPNFSPKRHA